MESFLVFVGGSLFAEGSSLHGRANHENAWDNYRWNIISFVMKSRPRSRFARQIYRISEDLKQKLRPQRVKACEVLSECGFLRWGGTGHIPITPFERSRWRGGRYACYTLAVMPHQGVLYRDFRFCVILATTVKSVGYRRESIQFP